MDTARVTALETTGNEDEVLVWPTTTISIVVIIIR